MNEKSSMAGWIGFAGMMMLIIGSIAFFEGLIALFEDDYFVVTRSGFLVVDLTTWGWIMLIWGIILVLAGLALFAGQAWARWFGIVAISLNILAQLRIPRQRAVPALGADGDDAEHRRPLRSDRTLEREQEELGTR